MIFGFRISDFGLRVQAILLVVAVCAPSPAAGQQQRDPKVQAVLDQCLAATRALSALHLHITVKTTNPDTFTPALPDSIDIRFQKPNKLRAEMVETKAGKLSKRVVVTDGISLWRWETGATAAVKAPAPKTLGEISDVPPASPDLAILLNPAFDFKEWPTKNVNLRLAIPERIGTDEVDVVEGGMGEPGVAGGANLRLYIGRKDHLIRGMVIQVNGKEPVTNKELTGKFEAVHDILETSPIFPPNTFQVNSVPPKPRPKPVEPKPARKP